MQQVKVHFQVQSCGFRRSFLKMVPCPSSQLQLILYAMKIVSYARGRGENGSGTFFTLRKMLFDRIVDFSRTYLISCDTDPNRQSGSRIRKGFKIDPHMLPVGKL
jgi:hypothetical protein